MEEKVPSYYSDTKFILRDVKIIFYKEILMDHLFASILSPLVNLTRAFQHIFERRFSWFYPPANSKFFRSFKGRFTYLMKILVTGSTGQLAGKIRELSGTTNELKIYLCIKR